MNRSRLLMCFAFFCAGLVAPRAAFAASLQKVAQSEWGGTGFPSYVNMYIYVPDKVATKPPIVVAPHHCQGTAQSTYSEMASLRSIADKTGFIMIMPEATGQNCWDAGSDRSLKHGGKGDTGAVVQMVKYTLGKYSGDPARVYSVGGSSGGIMTEALIGVYPDVFMAGVSLMGVPCGCWASGYNDVTGTGNNAQWSSCAGGTVTKTAQQWGDLVRSYFPGYTGHRPRLQHWHGTADTTIDYKNMAEDIKEWTNLLGLSQTPSGTDMPKSGTTHQFWKNGCGYVVYETFALSGVGHAVPFDGNAVAAYFGIDEAGGEDPETAACPGATPGGTGAGGASGATGGQGGSSSGGTTGAAGRNGGGAGGTAAGGAHTGGAVATGGVSTGGRGGGATGGAVTATGGVSGTGGNATATGGFSATGGITATGGRAATGGDAGSGPPPDDGNGMSGCSCAVSEGAGAGVATGTLLMAALGVLVSRAKRRRDR